MKKDPSRLSSGSSMLKVMFMATFETSISLCKCKKITKAFAN